MYHILLIHSSVDGHLGCFQDLYTPVFRSVPLIPHLLTSTHRCTIVWVTDIEFCPHIWVCHFLAA